MAPLAAPYLNEENKMNMPKIGIIGYGAVGKATHRWLAKYGSGLTEDDFVIYDIANSSANSGLLLQSGGSLSAVFVCINTGRANKEVAATLIISALDASPLSPYINAATHVFIRATVPPGTANRVEERLLPRKVTLYSWPELATEQDMSQYSEMFAPYLGVKDPKRYAETKLPSFLYRITATTEVIGDRSTIELLKLLSSLRRATAVNLIQEAVWLASAHGLDAELVEAEMAELVTPPIYAGWVFGGKCLEKDLEILMYLGPSFYSDLLLDANDKRLRQVESVIRKAKEKYKIRSHVIGVVGLENDPGSDCVINSPAAMFARRNMNILPYGPKKQVQAFLAGTNSSTPPTWAEHVAVLVLAQRAADKKAIPFTWLMKALRESEAPVKVVINACQGVITEGQCVEAMKWGAVFVDPAVPF